MKLPVHALFVGAFAVASVATIAASANAQINPQPANSPVAHYGTGGAGTGGIAPTLTTNGLPRIGDSAWEVHAQNVVGGSWGVLLYSATGQDALLPGVGRLYVQNVALWPALFQADGVPGTAGAGSASIPIPIPPAPALIGATYYGQGFFADSQAAAGGGISHTGGMAVTFIVPSITNSLGMEFAEIPPATFTMGSSLTEPNRQSDEIQHQVTLTRTIWMQTTEVTQAQWQAVMGSNPSHFQGTNLPPGESGANLPVESVTWNEVQSFLTMLNSMDPMVGYRLPTEAEWEYACRAGSTSTYSFGDSESALGSYGWFSTNSGSRPHEVATKAPNAFGLYDMHSNVWEWCEDWYGAYPTTPVTDPQGPSSGTSRVYRGGGWNSIAIYCRSAIRTYLTPVARGRTLGFRLVRTSR